MAAKRNRNFCEKGLESADVRIKRARAAFPVSYSHPHPCDILILVGYFRGKLTAPVVYPTSTGSRRFGAIPDAGDAVARQQSDAGHARAVAL